MRGSTPQQATTGLNSPRALRGGILPAAAILAITFLAYVPAIRGGFFWDDYTFLVNNRLIQAPDGLRRLWLTTETTEYLPLTYTLHWVEWRLWSDHPAGYHIVNVLLHAAGAVLLWRVLRRLGVPGAWLGGLLFAAHPVAVASAGWIMECKNALSMTFYLLSFLAYLTYDDHGERRWYGLALALFALGLLAKTSVVMLPVVLLLCAWWRRGRISRKDLLRSLPFFALSLALGLTTIWFQWHNAIGGWNVRPEGAASRIAAAGWILWFYLYKVLLPAGLCAIYPRWNADGSGILAFLPLLLLLGGMVFLWERRKKWGRAPFFAAAYFLVTLLPVVGFLNMSFMQYSLVADHLQYFAMIAVVAFAGGILARAAGPGASKQGTVALVAAGCVAVLAILTWRRASLYGDEILLWQDNVAKNPMGWGPWSNLGNALSKEGFHDEAIRCLDQAIALTPDFAPECYYNRAAAWAKVKDFAKAIQDYDKAIALKGDFAAAYYNRGLAYAQAHDLVQAIQDYDKAIALRGDFTAAYYSRGVAHAQARDLAKAIQDYDKAISLDQGIAAAYNNRGAAYDRLGRHDKAVRDYTKAIELDPGFAMAFCNRADAYLQTQRFAEAIQDYDSAVALKPDFAVAYKNRAVAYYDLREFSRAWEDVKMSEELGGQPDPEFLKALEQAAGRPE